MTPTTLSVGSRCGGICILNTRTALRDTLQRAADAVDASKFVPTQPPVTTTLRLAMHGVGIGLFGKRRKQPISSRHIDGNDFECVRVVPNGDRNEYHHLFSATIDKNWAVTVLAHNHDANSAFVEPALQSAVVQLRDYLPAPIVSRTAVRILQSWKAVPMAEGGGVWFLGESHLDKYRRFADILRDDGRGPLFTLTTFDIDANPETAGDVLSKVRETVKAGVAEIMDDIANATDGFSERSIKVRLGRANRLLSMVNEYRQLMGVDMPELTDAIEQAKQAVAVHRLLSASV
jgi:hypothetical protein